jgi:hypothetical protein
MKELSSLSVINNNEALIYYAKILELLYTLRRYLSANVAPQAVLEQVIYNL